MSGWWDSFTRFLSRRWLVAAEPPAPPRPELVGQLYSPGAKCYQAGVYALVRAGELVTRPDGLLELATMSASNDEEGEKHTFPPGYARGDRWQLVRTPPP